MALVLDQDDTYSWPCSIELPIDDGKYQKHSFKCVFKRLKQSRIKELLDLVAKGDVSDQEVCNEVLAGWSGIEDKDGNEVRFNKTTFKQLIEVPLIATEIGTAYFKSITGAKTKN
tara:strand:- start:1280 stop:1624 length:345 start_codon:yes stop_codon:yes gene_type:complete